jgi:hypothetical protein
MRTVQKLLGYKNINTTMIYTFMLNRGPYNEIMHIRGMVNYFINLKPMSFRAESRNLYISKN